MVLRPLGQRLILRGIKYWGRGNFPEPSRNRASGNFGIWEFGNLRNHRFEKKIGKSPIRTNFFSFLRGELHRDDKFLGQLLTARNRDQLFSFLRGEVEFRGQNRGSTNPESLMRSKAKSQKSSDLEDLGISGFFNFRIWEFENLKKHRSEIMNFGNLRKHAAEWKLLRSRCSLRAPKALGRRKYSTRLQLVAHMLR